MSKRSKQKFRKKSKSHKTKGFIIYYLYYIYMAQTDEKIKLPNGIYVVGTDNFNSTSHLF